MIQQGRCATAQCWPCGMRGCRMMTPSGEMRRSHAGAVRGGVQRLFPEQYPHGPGGAAQKMLGALKDEIPPEMRKNRSNHAGQHRDGRGCRRRLSFGVALLSLSVPRPTRNLSTGFSVCISQLRDQSLLCRHENGQPAAEACNPRARPVLLMPPGHAAGHNRKPRCPTSKQITTTPTCHDPEAAARAAKLHYVSDRRPGITRTRNGDGWVFHDPSGTAITDPKVPRPHPQAGDSAGLYRRLDLPRPARPSAGRRPGRQRPQAVPLPSPLARGPGRGENTARC